VHTSFSNPQKGEHRQEAKAVGLWQIWTIGSGSPAFGSRGFERKGEELFTGFLNCEILRKI
jgi:hypothetical protein